MFFFFFFLRKNLNRRPMPLHPARQAPQVAAPFCPPQRPSLLLLRAEELHEEVQLLLRLGEGARGTGITDHHLVPRGFLRFWLGLVVLLGHGGARQGEQGT
mmetsp:Transcript_675/g.498  ORF Transcript_675/g.498 Transcript_675/m.498 type:complete len:101 (-) Transcript_675:62-364(-)